MASLTIRNLDDELKALLRLQAARHGCSMEQEARENAQALAQQLASYIGPRLEHRLLDQYRWALQIPEQIQSAGNVRPLDPFVGGTDTLIEVHSHHNMGAFFSLTDNQEEQAGFRVYAVLGRVEHNPAINCRVGIYGHFCEIPAEWVFELPAGMVDASYPIDIEENEESEYVD